MAVSPGHRSSRTAGGLTAADFGGTLPTGTITIPAGQTSATLTLNVAGDLTYEGDEGFTVTLSNPSSNAQVAAASATGTIQNDDPLPSGNVIRTDPSVYETFFGTAGERDYFIYDYPQPSSFFTPDDLYGFEPGLDKIVFVNTPQDGNYLARHKVDDPIATHITYANQTKGAAWVWDAHLAYSDTDQRNPSYDIFMLSNDPFGV